MSTQPSPARLEAFSDGVIAVIITIMVLDLKVPHLDGPAGLLAILPTLAIYLVSFTFTGVYWINHHYLVDRLKLVDPLILWANLGLLFFLSLVPFFTNYLIEKGHDSFSVALYAASLLSCAFAFQFLTFAIGRHRRGHAELYPQAELPEHKMEAYKGWASILCYSSAVMLAHRYPAAALVLVGLVTIIWIVPSFGTRKAVACAVSAESAYTPHT